MSERSDLYAVLGLPPTATQGEITHAYRDLLRRHHPDTRESSADPTAADAALQDVLAAYAVLGEPDCRAAYDRKRLPSPRRPERMPGQRPQPPIQAGPVHWQRSGPPSRAAGSPPQLLPDLFADWLDL